MQILLLGATGRVGASVIEYALASNHHVIAVARNRAKMQIVHPQLTIIEGDLYRPQALIHAIQQPVDVLINVVGSNVFKPSTVVTDSVQTSFTLLKELGIQRYLGITGVAEMQPCNLLASFTRAAILVSPIRHAVHDHDHAFALVKASTINWVLAGCPYIRDGRHTETYKVVPGCFPGGFKVISPQDVADFLVKEVQAQRFTRQIVGIWN